MKIVQEVQPMKQIFVLLIFSIGVFAPNFFSKIPSLVFLGVFSAASLVLFYRFRQIWLIGLALGLIYGSLSASTFNDSILPESLNNQVFSIAGRIQGIPTRNDRIWRLEFIPEAIDLTAEQIAFYKSDSYLPKKIRLSYYGNPEKPFVSGEWLSLEAKLKRPHGLMNFGLFDYQRWLIGQSYSATGYIKKLVNRSGPKGSLAAVDAYRSYLSNFIEHSGVRHSGVQSALIVGDRQGISLELMELFVETGTVHLMVISGLHIGFVAAIGFFLSRWAISLIAVTRIWSPINSLNSVRWASICALFFAFCYSAAAGFSIPTIRALVMLAAILLPKVFYLKASPWWGLCLALALVALIEPRAVLQNGFWLSFCAVVLIFISIKWQGNSIESSRIKGNPVFSLMRIQLIFLFGFSTTLLMIQGQINLASFLANMIAVPMTGLIIVPLEMLAVLLFQIKAEYAVLIWDMAGRVIELEIWLLELLNKHFEFVLVRTSIPIYLGVMAAIAGLMFFGLSKHHHRAVAIACILPAFVPLPAKESLLEVRVFDVGQGLSLLVRQPGYSLIYDLGPRFSDSFDSGANILVPSLSQIGINQIDDLIISHPDSDHIGGYKGLVAKKPASRVWIGRKSENTRIAHESACIAGRNWQVGAVMYEFISPVSDDPGPDTESDNDRSCVLKITLGQQVILLPGDISAGVERILAREQRFVRGVDDSVVLLIAPHHGSKTSSSEELIESAAPEYVVFSAGYMNRFGHPHVDVVNRYKQSGAKIYSTFKEGMIRFTWNDVNEPAVIKTEAEQRIFWWQK